MLRLWPRTLIVLIAAALCVSAALAAANFPPLTGRVVDQAKILSPVAVADLERKLADLEQKSGIQLVVATVPSLGGEEIEPYANALFRAWKLGEAKKNNGALLLIAPKERRMRIEVGYGLEGTLTDAVSSLIIANAIAPRFRAGDFSGGVTRGVDDIITALTTDSAEWKPRPADTRAEHQASLLDTLAPILLFLFIMFVFSRMARRGAATSSSFRWAWAAAAGLAGADLAEALAAAAGSAAAFPAAAGRRAAAALRGDGDEPRP